MRSSKKVIITFIIIVLCSSSALYGFSYVKSREAQVFVYDPGEYFVTNITDSKSLLKSDLIIEIIDKAQYKEFLENTFKVRDIIINVLRSKSYEEVKNPNIQDILKLEINNKLNESFNTDLTQKIYFNEFVIQ